MATIALSALKNQTLFAVACAMTVSGWSALWAQAVLELDIVPPIIPAAAFAGGLLLAGVDRRRQRDPAPSPPLAR
ncbi:MAG: hypothetical protein ACM30I_02920 [Gemmatimonas sp.]